jgi:hypothetical protein
MGTGELEGLVIEGPLVEGVVVAGMVGIAAAVIVGDVAVVVVASAAGFESDEQPAMNNTVATPRQWHLMLATVWR